METPQTRKPETHSHKGRFTLLLTIALMLILAALLIFSRSDSETEYAANIASEDTDMLAYVSGDNNLLLYNPRTRTATKLLDNVDNFLIAHDGRVAFSPLDNGDIYIVDPAVPNDSPINITQNADTGHHPIAWSPDGRYLAFSSQQDRREQALYVWDGETIRNIMPENNPSATYPFYVDWSNTGQLAFTVRDNNPSEIYVWDGNRTFNLSQNPDSSDWSVSWNSDGQLLFTSYQDRDSNTYVWDGISFDGETPDVDTFTTIDTGEYSTSVTWTEDGNIMYTLSPAETHSGTPEIILWDLESQSIVEQFSALSSSSWLVDDNQLIISSGLASGLPAFYLDVTDIEGQILFSEITGEFSWSTDGYLAYCLIDRENRDRGWILSIWDGEETWAVTDTYYKPIQWQSEQHTFSCNAG